jgi:hypothetical protein
MKTIRTIRAKFKKLLVKFYLLMSELSSVPISTLIILSSNPIHESYRMSMFKKLRLGLRMYLNTRHITTGTSYRAHLVVASKHFFFVASLYNPSPAIIYFSYLDHMQK